MKHEVRGDSDDAGNAKCKVVAREGRGGAERNAWKQKPERGPRHGREEDGRFGVVERSRLLHNRRGKLRSRNEDCNPNVPEDHGCAAEVEEGRQDIVQRARGVLAARRATRHLRCGCHQPQLRARAHEGQHARHLRDDTLNNLRGDSGRLLLFGHAR